MIITCKKCSTSFNLDDSLVKENGSKCRCSVCKHIFTAYPLPLDPLSLDEGDLTLSQEEERKPVFADEENTVEDKVEEIEPETPVIIPEDDFSEYDDVLDQKTEPEFDETLEDETLEEKTLEEEIIKIEDLQEEEKSSLTQTPSSRRKKKKSVISTPVLLLVLICFLVAGVYITSVITGYKIPYLSNINIPFVDQYLKKTVPKAINAKPVPNQKSVNGRFVTNTSTGTLFVITGMVENFSNTVYSHIQIQGTLITKRKKEEKTKNAFCGNIIPEEMLKTGNIADINKLLVIKTGNNNSNAQIKPNTNIPFMIVFSELPEKLENFTVKVIGFDKAKVK